MTQLKRVLVMQGPNLNMLGLREPEIYGAETLADICRTLDARAAELGLALEHFQSNHEGVLIDKLHEVFGKIDGIIINPGGFTHTSVALRDALAMQTCPIIEVHISNIHKREPFRHHSYVADIAHARLEGFGINGYLLALNGLAEIF